MAPVHTSQLRASHWHQPFPLGDLEQPSTKKALAPARGALVGAALGLGCWALLAAAVWALV